MKNLPPGLSLVPLLVPLLALSLASCATIKEYAARGDELLYELSDSVARPDEVTGERSLNLTSKEEEIRRSERMLDQIVADPTLVGAQPGAELVAVDDARYRRLVQIFDRVVSTSHAADEVGKSVGFVYFDDPLQNAFALGGNKMVFFSGFTASVDDDELAIVIGHEMAHNVASHISEQRASRLLVGLAGGDTGRAGWQAAFTLKAEQEADELGILYAALAGYDPFAAARLWQRRPDPAGYSYFRTHPSNPERTQHNYTIATQVKRYYEPGQVNPDAPEILVCNVLYCRQDQGPKAGQGGGLVAALMTVATAYLKQEETKQEIARQEAEIAQQRQELLATAPELDLPAGWVAFRGVGIDRQGSYGVATAFASGQAIVVSDRDGREYRTDLEYHGENEDGTWYRWSSAGQEGLAVVQFDQERSAFQAHWFLADETLGGRWSGEVAR